MATASEHNKITEARRFPSPRRDSTYDAVLQGTTTSSTSLCRRSGVGVDPGAADDAGAGPGRKQGLQVVQDRVQAQTGDPAFGSVRSRVRNSWAAVTRVTWRCQPAKVRPSEWSRPGPVFTSG